MRDISIHKALAGLDRSRDTPCRSIIDFNPQGPRGPRRGTSVILWYHRNFNPQGPRGPRPSIIHLPPSDFYFNPQGPRGPRLLPAANVLHHITFQSTRPSRASTFKKYSDPNDSDISIHKALAGLDIIFSMYSLFCCYFNPQGPRGPRPGGETTVSKYSQFQSTRPSRASTFLVSLSSCFGVISIHKALAGLDIHTRPAHSITCNFNPQGPRGPRRNMGDR